MTGISFDRIGSGADGAARAARRHAVRVAAGPALAAPADPGRTPHREVRRDEAVQQAVAVARADAIADTQPPPRERRMQRGADLLFLAQRFAQEEVPADRPAVSPAFATAHYPSLGLRQELILPGQPAGLAEGRHYMDIYA